MIHGPEYAKARIAEIATGTRQGSAKPLIEQAAQACRDAIAQEESGK